MAKIKIESVITSKDDKNVYNGSAILKDNVIVYNENKTVTSIKLEDDFITLIRDNDDYKYNFIFKENEVTKAMYNIKKLNRSFDLDVKTLRLVKKENSILISYELFLEKESNGKFNYELKWSM